MRESTDLRCGIGFQLRCSAEGCSDLEIDERIFVWGIPGHMREEWVGVAMESPKGWDS